MKLHEIIQQLLANVHQLEGIKRDVFLIAFKNKKNGHKLVIYRVPTLEADGYVVEQRLTVSEYSDDQQLLHGVLFTQNEWKPLEVTGDTARAKEEGCRYLDSPSSISEVVEEDRDLALQFWADEMLKDDWLNNSRVVHINNPVFEFTPGDWLDSKCGIVTASSWQVICSPDNYSEESANEMDANGRLIAAAPQMLGLLIDAAQNIGYEDRINHPELGACFDKVSKLIIYIACGDACGGQL